MKTQHGVIPKLDSKAIIEVLQRGYIGHLGCSINDEIYVVPISYVFDEGYIYSHSRQGKKIEIMREHPNICIQVEEIKNYFDWRSIICWGRFEELDGDEADRAMRLMIEKIIEKEGDQHVSALEVDLKAVLESSIMYRMKIEKSSGRYEAFE